MLRHSYQLFRYPDHPVQYITHSWQLYCKQTVTQPPTFTSGCSLIIDNPGTMEHNGFMGMDDSGWESMLLTKAYLLFKLLGPIKDYLLVLPEKIFCEATLYCVLIAKTKKIFCW